MSIVYRGGLVLSDIYYLGKNPRWLGMVVSTCYVSVLVQGVGLSLYLILNKK